MKRLFKGGTVVGVSGKQKLDVLVKGEKILVMGENLSYRDAQIIDVEGKLLFPGFIDPHTHMELEVSGTVTADGFDTGTKAAVSGGTTCIIDFATQNKGESLRDALLNWHRKADGNCSCDYAFHLALSDWNKSVSEELEQVIQSGIHSFKVYMTYDTMVMDDKGIYELLSRLKELGGIAGVHCENKGIIDARVDAVLEQKGSRKHVSDYPKTRPALAEAEAIGRLLKIARCVDTPVIIVHVSSKEGYEEIRRAREEGQTVYMETCPQYLLLDEEVYTLENGDASNYVIAPPLRTKADREVLWAALTSNLIQTVATDHCSFTKEQKRMGEHDFTAIPCGMPGVEERPALLWQFGVREGRLTEEQMCQYLSENPAKLYHLFPKKGILAPGSDADIVVWNSETEWTLTKDTQQSMADYCPMEGTVITGRAEQVYLRGELVAENGKILCSGHGKYIREEM